MEIKGFFFFTRINIEPVPILLISSFNGQTGNHLAMSIRPSASKLSSLFAF